MKLLDLFCGAGGAAMGYHRAGFEVTGVDIKPQPRYPFDFRQADALTFPLGGFDAVHASPPCQHHARVTAWRGSRGDHPNLLTPTLDRMHRAVVPWVVENVPEALPAWDYVLRGSQFGLPVKRHRGFLAGNWTGSELLSPCHHQGLMPFMHKNERAYTDAMGCTWMTYREGRQAIPPAFTEYLGRQLIGALT